MGLPPTARERCLLYLLDRADVLENEPRARELTLARIPEGARVPRPQASRAMGRLRDRGLVKETKVHVRGEARRRVGFVLTEAGLREAQALRRRLEEERVVLVDLEGRESERRLYEVPLLLPKRPRFSDLIACMEGGRLDLRGFLDRQSRIKAGKVFDAPEASVPAHFQGRSEELSRLDMFLNDPRARALLVVGLPGIGKTGLVSRWITGHKGREHVLWRRVRADTRARDLLCDVAGLLSEAGRPALADSLRRPPDSGLEGSLLILRRDAVGLRAILVIDDAHLAGKDVAAVLDELVHGEGEGGLRVVLVARERVRLVRAEDVARGRTWELELTDLPSADARALLQDMSVGSALQEAILQRCGGHPLALQLAATGRLPPDGVRRASASWFAEDALSRLSPASRDALALAAVMEGPVDRSALGPASRELMRRCLLREAEGGKAVIHDLVREAVLADLSPRRRSALHVRAGKILAGSELPTDAHAAVRHFIKGGALRLAERVAAARGEEVVEAGFAEPLLSELDRRLWAAEGHGIPPRVLLLRGHALFALGRWAEAVRAYEEASAAGAPGVASEALMGQGKAEVQRGSRLALPLLTSARDRFEKSGALRRLAEVQYWIGGVHEDAGHPDDAREAFERGRAVASDVGDRRWEGLCAYGIGRLQSQQADYEGAVAIEQEALRLLEREGNRLDIAKVCAGLGGNLLELGRLREAEGYLDRAASVARAAGATGILAMTMYNLASLRWHANRISDALGPFAEALEAFEAQEQYDNAAQCAAWLAFGEWSMGRTDAGSRHARRADSLVERVGEPALRARALRHLARAFSDAGRKADAGAYLRRAVDEARKAKLDLLAADLSAELDQLT